MILSEKLKLEYKCECGWQKTVIDRRNVSNTETGWIIKASQKTPELLVQCPRCQSSDKVKKIITIVQGNVTLRSTKTVGETQKCAII